MATTRSIYSVAIGGIDCRCARDLITLKVRQVDGVEAATVGSDDVLTVFADRLIVSADDLVRAIVDAGFVPAETVSVEDVAARAVASIPETTEQVVEPEAVEAESARAEALAEPQAVDPSVEFEAAWSAATARLQEPDEAGCGTARAESAPAREVATIDSPLEGVSETPVFEPFAHAELVQRLDVAVSDSYYPSHLVVQAHVPVEIGFGEGHGCLARVLFEEFGIDADLTDGGATVRLPGLEEGTYSFSCGMKMVFGSLVAVA